MASGSLGRRRLQGEFALSPDGLASGSIRDLDEPAASFVVELLADGIPFTLVWAHEAADSGVVGLHAFSAQIPEVILRECRVLEARLANTGLRLGPPLSIADTEARKPAVRLGGLSWRGGLRLTGWLASPEAFGGEIKAIVDGIVAANARANHWTQRAFGAHHAAFPAFVLDLPEALADSRVRAIEVVGPDAQPLPGSPCLVIAFPDALASFIESAARLDSERLRARFADDLLPQALPFERFADYRQRYPPPVFDSGAACDIALVLVGALEGSAEADGGETSARLVLHLLERAGTLTFHPHDLAGFLANEGDAADIVVFAPAGTGFHPGGLPLLVATLRRFDDADVVYCDLISGEGSAGWPQALTAFDYERCLEQGYCSMVFAIRRAKVVQALAQGAACLFSLFLSAVTMTTLGQREPVHLPEFLARVPQLPRAELTSVMRLAAEFHFRTRGEPVVITERLGAIPAIKIRRKAAPVPVSVIVLNRDRPEVLSATLGSLFELDANLEIIVSELGPADSATAELVQGMNRQGVSLVRTTDVINLFRARNEGAIAARNPILLFLNAGLVGQGKTWFEELQDRAMAPAVGAAGPVHLWPSGIIRSAGQVLGPGLGATDAFSDRMLGDPGYGGLLGVAHAVSALSSDALMVPRALFLRLGGFDASSFALSYGDVDFSLRLRREQLKLIMVPDAKLVAEDTSLDFRRSARPEVRSRLERELTIFRARWGDSIVSDPYYSPWLALSDAPYGGLSWPPRDRAPRRSMVAPPRSLPHGL